MVVGEDAEDALKRPRAVADGERHADLVPAGGYLEFIREDHEARTAAGVVADVGGDHLKPVQFCGEARGDDGLARRVFLGDLFYAFGGAEAGNGLDFGMVLKEGAAASEHLFVRVYLRDLFEFRPFGGGEAVVEADVLFARDVEAVFVYQFADAGHRPSGV